MNKIRLTKEFKFEMAHALKGYNGPCQSIHGHSYELWVTVIGKPNDDPNSPDYGMIMDFKKLKEIVRENFINDYDHSLVLPDSVSQENIDAMGELAERLIVVPWQPTTENLLTEIVRRVGDKLPEGVSLHSLKIQETVTSYAEWHATDNE
ncbi:MAG: 6-pyruvoyl tetrahydropterin synthase family protein [Bacteroidales bacterium]|nr:6-pyruvoyl tetrahydropterin synthase family protein [Bacteroidales bacterium]